jgi:hypothetical protein
MLEGMALALPALQIFNTLDSNFKFESDRVVPLLSIEHVLDVLVSWRLMTWSDAPASRVSTTLPSFI